MKLSGRAVNDYISAPGIVAGALIYGQDAGLVRQRVAALSQAYLKGIDDPLAQLELTSEKVAEDPALLANALAAFSLMASRRVILLREVDDTVREAVDAALQGRAESNFLILYSTQSLSGSKLRAWAEQAGHFHAIACYPEEGAQLQSLVRDTLKAYGLRAESDVIRFLSNHLQGDRQIVLNELEKLSLYVGNEAEIVTMDDAAATTADMSERGMDDLAIAVASAQPVTVCQLADRLLREGHVPLLLIRAAMRHLQRLQQLSLRPPGQPIETALEQLRPPVFFKLKPILKSQAANWDFTKCEQALAMLQLLEIESKRFSDAPARVVQGLLNVAQLPEVRRHAG